jgi:hypothetical protein
MISAAECTLIGHLRPLMNQKDRLGFSGQWKFRDPDQIAIMDELEPHLNRNKVEVWVEERPGVYAWFMDPSSSHLYFSHFLSGMPWPQADSAKAQEARQQCLEIVKAKERIMAKRGFVLSSTGQAVAKDLPFA